MYQESYEDYIRSILGYPNYGYNNDNRMPNQYQSMPVNSELEACYPEIYKVVYPMVRKACYENTSPLTEELIDQLTDEIYLSVENDNEINVTINLGNEVGGNINNRSKSANIPEKPKENRGEDRQFRNRGLQDLIRILLIRELLGRPGNPGHRPPRPPMEPGRPPMRPPFPGGRMSDLYER